MFGLILKRRCTIVVIIFVVPTAIEVGRTFMFMCCTILYEGQPEVSQAEVKLEAQGFGLQQVGIHGQTRAFWRTYILKAPNSLVDIARGIFVKLFVMTEDYDRQHRQSKAPIARELS